MFPSGVPAQMPGTIPSDPCTLKQLLVHPGEGRSLLGVAIRWLLQVDISRQISVPQSNLRNCRFQRVSGAKTHGSKTSILASQNCLNAFGWGVPLPNFGDFGDDECIKKQAHLHRMHISMACTANQPIEKPRHAHVIATKQIIYYINKTRG